MACLPLPKASVPSIAPLSVSATIPALAFDPDLCCKIPIPQVATPPIPLGPGILNPTVLAVIQSQLAIVVGFVNSLSIPCPKE